jgi:hypothetical protein
MEYFIKYDPIFGDAIFSSDNQWIPFDEMNTDYQAYLAWVAEGNTAEEWTGN